MSSTDIEGWTEIDEDRCIMIGGEQLTLGNIPMVESYYFESEDKAPATIGRDTDGEWVSVILASLPDVQETFELDFHDSKKKALQHLEEYAR